MSEPRPSELSLEELASRTGQPAEDLLRWRSLGLVGAESREGFSLEDLEIARLIQFCLRRGAGIDTIAAAEEAEPGFLRNYLTQLFPSGVEPTYSPEEAAALTGLDVDVVRRVRELTSAWRPTETIDGDDLAALRGWKVALDNGFPEEACSRW